jgi:hypothetical protein
MIAEMIHSASLIHDDVIDQSFSRRGKPSVNVLWNHKKVSTQKALFIIIRVLSSFKCFSMFPVQFSKATGDSLSKLRQTFEGYKKLNLFWGLLIVIKL